MHQRLVRDLDHKPRRPGTAAVGAGAHGNCCHQQHFLWRMETHNAKRGPGPSSVSGDRIPHSIIQRPNLQVPAALSTCQIRVRTVFPHPSPHVTWVEAVPAAQAVWVSNLSETDMRWSPASSPPVPEASLRPRSPDCKPPARRRLSSGRPT